MATLTRLLKDKNGNIVLPQTNAVLVLTGTSNVAEELETIKNRLDKNKGVFLSLEALQTAYPTAENGDWAIVNAIGDEPKKYIWDANTGETGWYLMGAFSGVESVNGENGDVVLSGGDINSILSVEGVDTTKTITQWLQQLKTDLNTITAEEINATINSETKSVNDFLQDLHDDIDTLNNKDYDPILVTDDFAPNDKLQHFPSGEYSDKIVTNGNTYFTITRKNEFKDMVIGDCLFRGLFYPTSFDLAYQIYNTLNSENIELVEDEVYNTNLEFKVYDENDELYDIVDVKLEVKKQEIAETGMYVYYTEISKVITRVTTEETFYDTFYSGGYAPVKPSGWSDYSAWYGTNITNVIDNGYVIFTKKDESETLGVANENFYYSIRTTSQTGITQKIVKKIKIDNKQDIENIQEKIQDHNTDETAHPDKLTTVSSDTTLSGNGTSTDPLSVVEQDSVLSGTLNYLSEGTDILDLVLDGNNYGKTFYLNPNITYPNEPFNGFWLNTYNIKTPRKITLYAPLIFGEVILNYQTELSFASSFPFSDQAASISNLHTFYNINASQFVNQATNDYFFDLSSYGNSDIWKIGNYPTTQINTNKSLINGSVYLSVNEDWLNEKTDDYYRPIKEKNILELEETDIDKLIKWNNKLYQIKNVEEDVNKFKSGIEYPSPITFDTTATPQTEYATGYTFVEATIDIYDSSLEEPVRSIYMFLEFNGYESSYNWFFQDGETTTTVYNNSGWQVSSYGLNIPVGGKAQVNSNLGYDGNYILEYLGSLINETPTSTETNPSAVEIGYTNETLPQTATFTLSSANWSANEYTLNLTGSDLEDLVLSDYLVEVVHTLATKDIFIKSKTTNEIVFETTTAPTSDIDVEIKYIKKGV